MFTPDFETYHLAGMNLVMCEGASGAPAAVFLPFDFDTERILHEDDFETLYCN